jgi:FMN-dependent NADH-azoreductase
MTKILHLDSSARAQASVTRALTARIVETLRRADPQAEVTYRDLTLDALPHIGPEYLNGLFAGGATPSHETVMLSDRLIEELFAADILVIGAPMYNFSIPSQLKAWIDYVLRAGKTFHYTAEGKPEGLVQHKRAIVAVASGGAYAEGPMQPFDHVAPLLRQILNFIGIVDVTVIRAERQAFGPEMAGQEKEKAEREIETHLQRTAAA